MLRNLVTVHVLFYFFHTKKNYSVLFCLNLASSLDQITKSELFLVPFDFLQNLPNLKEKSFSGIYQTLCLACEHTVWFKLNV